jgi:hypothetical protein
LDIWSLSEKVKNGFNMDFMEIYADGYFPYTNSFVKMAWESYMKKLRAALGKIIESNSDYWNRCMPLSMRV